MCLFLCSCTTKWGGKKKRVRDLCGASWGQSGHVTLTDLLRVTVCERQFSCNMKHDFSPMKGSVDCFTSCLTVTHVQSSFEPGDREWGHSVIWFITRVICLIKRNLILPGEALQLDRLSQNRQELYKLLALLIVTKYVLLGDLQRGEGHQTGRDVAPYLWRLRRGLIPVPPSDTKCQT